MMEQKTLRETVRFEGVGLHTGAHAAVELRPAGPDTGIVFVVRSEGAAAAVRIPAEAEYVVDTSRATVLGRDGATVSTTEHLLSALFASGVSNAEIHVSGPEIPVRDGSAREFLADIESAGLVAQGRPRTTATVTEPFVVQSGDRMVAALPAPAFRVRFVADFPAPIGTQYYYGAVEPDVYREEIAGARTFGYLHEVQALRARGLALGGSLDNALVFAPDGPMQPLRWPNEVVRHKVLDLVGDFALLGAWPRCEIVAIKSGHELHALVTRELRSRAEVS
ncbi:MAG: UDP-3-O-[3-hydroxymyristoyl] N-acetylglucosamine deacetylase [Candidatus Eremiobacteraeota bacterium]|nr:UDP-3-O-[3-hydroxymyristoyl] N-acetylglucosamine deacetylase [Candidatus Eremiobacteraeota bacterium]MBV8283459.1 UDP-3-O-[3-hydroxymyristoyl] N-acetylglucosamine deacetylase [Candidatus Eremiobacteraeota bacterium]MBV8432774.1 UDP-3-O-[3-hydroxymyristoyl] N-acetylglucosamine deacetylase [Candidatus Eremiobacteraeota bacterium]MBV8655732.1 UDP-3-O-[3-hydroxymyristoyl] N-acetylglucosamine deacetylase [Candidatus Eremiobacteraeota bacterium]